jgi:hypothetical protein
MPALPALRSASPPCPRRNCFPTRHPALCLLRHLHHAQHLHVRHAADNHLENCTRGTHGRSAHVSPRRRAARAADLAAQERTLPCASPHSTLSIASAQRRGRAPQVYERARHEEQPDPTLILPVCTTAMSVRRAFATVQEGARARVGSGVLLYAAMTRTRAGSSVSVVSRALEPTPSASIVPARSPAPSAACISRRALRSRPRRRPCPCLRPWNSATGVGGASVAAGAQRYGRVWTPAGGESAE